MAIEPKGGRKRVLKRITKKDKENQDVATENSVVNESEDKKSSVIPSPIFQAEDGIRDRDVTGVQTCALPI